MIMESPSVVRGKLDSVDHVAGAVVASMFCKCKCGGSENIKVSLPDQYAPQLSQLEGKSIMIVRAGYGYSMTEAA